MNDLNSLEKRIRRLEDVHEIANLKARYMNGADGGWDFNMIPADADAIVPLFAENGVWISDSQGSAAGRAAIHEAWRKYSGAMPFAIQWISNPLIEVDGDTAKGEWHLTMQGFDANGVEFWCAGIYYDKFVRTGEGWRILETHPRLIYLGPYKNGFRELVASAQKRNASENLPPEWSQMHAPTTS